MLDGPRQQGVALDLDRLALAVQAPRHHLHVTLDLADVAGHGEAAFQADLLALPLDHLGIDQRMQVGVGLDHHHPQPHPDLGRRQPDARRGHHGVNHIVDQLADAAVDARHPLRLLAKDRRFLGQDGKDSHDE